MLNLGRIYLCLVILLLNACAVSRKDENVEQPNILMLSVDDMNDWVGCLNGYPGVKTPNIDRLAASGVNFTNAHCASPKCGPSRTAIFTGLMPATTGIYDNNQWWKPNLPTVKTIPMVFRENGYKVLGAGKNFHHTAGNNPPDQWDEYFQLIFDDDWDRTKPNQQPTYPWVEPLEKPDFIPLNGILPYQHEYDWGTLPIEESAYGDMQTVDWVKKQLNEAHDKPFFLAAGLYHPHLPWYAPEKYFQKYPLKEVVLPKVPENDLDDIPKVGLQLAEQGASGYKKVLENNQWEQAVQAYLANITFADYMVGEILNALEKSSYAKNTLVILWSDHGWHLGEKQHWYKSTLWERATHVPFIIAGPGVNQGKTDEPVSLVDIFPTLAVYCQLKETPPLDGESLFPFFKDLKYTKQNPTLITFREGNHAVREKNWKYIQYHDGGEELYDLKVDPNEWENLASNSTFKLQKEQMRSFLPQTNAATKPTKKAFDFDFETYTWKKK